MSLIPKVGLFTTHKQSLGQGNVSTRVYNSVHRRGVGWLPNMHHKSHDQPPGWGGGSVPPGETRKVGSTHPTRMLSSFLLIFFSFK